jgi:hypothetical protein
VNLSRHTQIKPAMRDFVIFEVIKIFQQNTKERFRRNDIKIKLPEFIERNYYDSELTRILQYLVEVNLIIHSPNLHKNRRPGRPTNSAISGPKLYYQASPLLININNLLNNSEAKNIIYKYLLDSGILLRFYVNIRINISYSKKGNKLEAAKINREIVKFPQRKNELEFEKEFHNDSIKINQMDKQEIQQEAQIWAKMTLNKLSADNFLWLYPIGAVYYYANLLNHLFIYSSPLSIED